MDTNEEATGIIEVRDDGGQDQSESSGNGEMGLHPRHMLKVELSTVQAFISLKQKCVSSSRCFVSCYCPHGPVLLLH